MTLACKDANSKLVEVVTVADVGDEDRVGNSLLQIWKLRFGHKANFCSLFTCWLGLKRFIEDLFIVLVSSTTQKIFSHDQITKDII